MMFDWLIHLVPVAAGFLCIAFMFVATLHDLIRNR